MGASESTHFVGGQGNDALVGGEGNDTLTGGPDSDRFDYRALPDAGTAGDTITDFQTGADDLYFHDLLAACSGYTPATAVDGGYLRFAQAGGDTLVRWTAAAPAATIRS